MTRKKIITELSVIPRKEEFRVREHPLVLARDAAGNATRVLCRLEVTRLHQGGRRPRGGRGNRLLPVFGLWLYSPLVTSLKESSALVARRRRR